MHVPFHLVFESGVLESIQEPFLVGGVVEDHSIHGVAPGEIGSELTDGDGGVRHGLLVFIHGLEFDG